MSQIRIVYLPVFSTFWLCKTKYTVKLSLKNPQNYLIINYLIPILPYYSPKYDFIDVCNNKKIIIPAIRWYFAITNNYIDILPSQYRYVSLTLYRYVTIATSRNKSQSMERGGNRTVRFEPEMGQIGTKWDNSRTLSEQISVHFGATQIRDFLWL